MRRSLSKSALGSKGGCVWIRCVALAKVGRVGARFRFVSPLLWAGAVAGLLFVAVWNDLLPGGWTLRGWFVDPRARAAQAYREHREARLREFAAALPHAPSGAVAFVGSSTIERFELGRFFSPQRVLNLGIGDEPLDELRERWTIGLPEDIAALVLYAGSVDFRRRACDVESFARRAAELVDDIRTRRPRAHLLVLGLLPERDMANDVDVELERWNERLASLAQTRGALFLALDREPLRAGDGSLAEAFSCDRLHLSVEGYEVLSRWILAEGGAIAKMLGP